MSQVMSWKIYVLALLLLQLTGCGSGAGTGKVFVPESGHPENWVDPLFVGDDTFHGTFLKTSRSSSPGSGLFLRHCAACHGETGAGKIGPNIQGISLTIINSAISFVPLMKGHSILSQEERAEIAGYLATIRVDPVPATANFDTSVCIGCHGEDLKGGIAAISCYSCHNGPDGSLGHPAGWTEAKDRPVLFHGSYGRTFVRSCASCHGFDLNGGIGPRCSTCHDGSTVPLLPPFSL